MMVWVIIALVALLLAFLILGNLYENIGYREKQLERIKLPLGLWILIIIACIIPIVNIIGIIGLLVVTVVQVCDNEWVLKGPIGRLIEVLRIKV